VQRRNKIIIINDVASVYGKSLASVSQKFNLQTKDDIAEVLLQ